MSLVKRLLARAGLIVLETPPVPQKADTAAPTRPILKRRSLTLAELLAETQATHAQREAELQTAAAGLTADFGAIFQAAGVSDPPHGWSIEKAAAFVRDPERAAKGRAEQRRALQAQLAIEQVPPEDVVRDATARDAAADAYEVFLRARVAELTDGLGVEQQRLEEERRQIDARLAAIADERKAIRGQFTRWCDDKRQRELAWAEALTCLAADDTLEQTWVSVSEELAAEE